MFDTPEELSNQLQKMVKLVLSGLQRTNYPISYLEQSQVLEDYQQLVFKEEYKKESFRPPRLTQSFIGPSLKTLELNNICKPNKDIVIPNIREEYAYTVTEKADGERTMLFVNHTGKIYLINMNMSVIFTGAQTADPKCANSLLDGEWIIHNKHGDFINMFAAFDMYYYNNIDIRAKPLMIPPSLSKEKEGSKTARIAVLKRFLEKLNPVPINANKSSSSSLSSSSPIRIVAKKYYPDFDSSSSSFADIFEASKYILDKINNHMFEYEIDGLIYTPTKYGVGGNKLMATGPKSKKTWEECFKWKPPSYNTIDFLVVTSKQNGADIVTPIFEKGINTTEATQFNQYKTLTLTVGFDESRHGYINPCQAILDNKPVTNDAEGNRYQLKRFYPVAPFDENAGLCNVLLKKDTSNVYQMFTEAGEVFADEMVVEFRYDMTRTGLWRWIPMRVRYDKTADYKSKQSLGANDFSTANNNWSSIHFPVTEEMISTGTNIPSIEVSQDVYYNNITNNNRYTENMRNFHNLYVKMVLIQRVSKPGNILIDFACGKGGDIPKWIAANLSFVMGVDVKKDNIDNRLNGACSRYLNYKKETDKKKMPDALFIVGNSSLNIRSGANMYTDKGNVITRMVFATSPKDDKLEPAILKQYGKGTKGFDVSSCQFAIHYMFENKRTFYNFIRNVAECTKMNGYFIGCCYDGRKIFDMFRREPIGKTEEIYVNDVKIWSITKDYNEDRFEPDDSCLGYKIGVFQDTINQNIDEYLVNMDFLTITMEKYGLKLISRNEAGKLGLPSGSGMFSDMFNQMMKEGKAGSYKGAKYMTPEEKQISFLNRFFVFKKHAEINAEKLTTSLLNELPFEEKMDIDGTKTVRKLLQEEKQKEKQEQEEQKEEKQEEQKEEQEEQKEEQEQKEEEKKQATKELEKDIKKDLKKQDIDYGKLNIPKNRLKRTAKPLLKEPEPEPEQDIEKKIEEPVLKSAFVVPSVMEIEPMKEPEEVKETELKKTKKVEKKKKRLLVISE